jgi:hypothetical protein
LCCFRSGQTASPSLKHDLEEAARLGACMFEACLAGASLKGAILSDAWMWHADLSRAILEDTKFGRAHLGGAVFRGAYLPRATFSGADAPEARFDDADLRKARFDDHARLEKCTFRRTLMYGAMLRPGIDLDGVEWAETDPYCARERLLDETLARDDAGWQDYCAAGHCVARPTLAHAERIYRQIKLCYQHSGRYDEAGQFFVREMECQRAQLKSPFARGVYGLLYLLSDYFENWMRVAVIGLIVIVIGALFQGLCGIRTSPKGEFVVGPGIGSGPPTWASVRDAVYFSVVTFTTTGYGDYVPNRGVGQVLASIEALTGVLLMALLLVCLARRYGRA